MAGSNWQAVADLFNMISRGDPFVTAAQCSRTYRRVMYKHHEERMRRTALELTHPRTRRRAVAVVVDQHFDTPLDSESPTPPLSPRSPGDEMRMCWMTPPGGCCADEDVWCDLSRPDCASGTCGKLQ